MSNPADDQHFPVVLFIKLHKMVLIFETVDEILKFDHSNESSWVALSSSVVYFTNIFCGSSV